MENKMRAARAASAGREKPPPPLPPPAAPTSEPDDALAKRCKEALNKRLEILQRCKEAGTAYSCLVDLQEALSASRGETRSLRNNYDELYEICESWHLQCEELKAERDRRGESLALVLNHEEESKQWQTQIRRLNEQLEASQQQLAASEQEASSLKQAVGASTSQQSLMKKAIAQAREELERERAAREEAARGAAVAAAQAQAALSAELQQAGASVLDAKECSRAAEAEARALRERLQEVELAAVLRAAEEREARAARETEEKEGEAGRQAREAETARLRAEVERLEEQTKQQR